MYEHHALVTSTKGSVHVLSCQGSGVIAVYFGLQPQKNNLAQVPESIHTTTAEETSQRTD